MASEELTRTTEAESRWRRWDFGPARGLNSYWRARIDEDPMGRNTVVTAEVTFGDVQLYVAERPLTTTSGHDGTVYTYLPLLDGGFELSLTYEPGTPGAQARSFTVRIPSDLVQPQRVVRRGRPLAGRVELSLQYDGGDHDQRIVVMRGVMEDGVDGGPEAGGVLTAAVSDPKVVGDLSLAPWTTSSESWPDIPDQGVGFRYPIAVNRAVYIEALPVDDGTTSTFAQFLFAYGHGWTVDLNSGVRIDNTARIYTHPEYAWEVNETTDALGVPVSLIKFTGTHTWAFTETVQVIATGGVFADNLIDSIRYLVEGFSSLGRAGISRWLFAEARARLGDLDYRVLANASGEEDAAHTLEFIEGQLLTSAPMVSMVYDVDGYGPVVTDQRDRLVGAELVAGQWPLTGRSATWRELPQSECYNSFTVRYNYIVPDGNFNGVVTRTPSNNVLCQVSADLLGARQHDPIDSYEIDRDEDADYLVDWLVEHLALPPYDVEYPAVPWLLLYLRRGDNVLLTDDWFGWVDQRATVLGFTYRRSSLMLKLRVWVRYYDLGGGAAGAPSPGQQ